MKASHEWRLKRQEWKKKPEGPSPEFNPEWNDQIWQRFRDWLLEKVFNNKGACVIRDSIREGDNCAT